jgi:phage tail-like protein
MIDVNRQRFFLLAGPRQFDLRSQGQTAEWSEARQVMRLRSTRLLENLPTDRARARKLADQPPITIDAFGTWARVEGSTIVAGGVQPEPIPIFPLPAGERAIDMAMNPEGVLYLLSKDEQDKATVHLIDRRGSKENGKTAFRAAEDKETATKPSIPFPDESRPDCLVALAQGGALLLDRSTGTFWQIIGKPLRAQPTAIYPPTTPRPCADGPLGQELIRRYDLGLPKDWEPVAMAANPDGEVAVLLYPKEADEPAAVALISAKGMSGPVPLEMALDPYSIGWVRGDEWALLFADRREALVYPIPWPKNTPAAPEQMSGLRYPLNWGLSDRQKNRKFCNGLSRPVFYPSTDKQGGFLPRPLHALSFPSYAPSAVVHTAKIIDSGEPNTVWHRLFLEAHLPKGTGVIVYLAAAESPEEIENPPEWAEHHFGSITPKTGTPSGVWINDTSEVPFCKSLLPRPLQPGTAGVFSVLVQRAGHTVRSVRGRYLNVKIELRGGGNSSPEVAGLRIYYPRFSYLEHYLPELYRETNIRQKASENGPASGPDFLQRFLCLFESFLTPLEDKVAAAYMLTNPASAPAEALDWLGQWIGLSGEIELTEEQKRVLIQNATSLYRMRGTMRGLTLALDLLTGKMVRDGEIVLLEDFRLRRTFATILGADFSVDVDPLLMAKIPSVNSYVGETLFLGEEEKKEFLALYGQDLKDLRPDEQLAIDNFYAMLANRLTVLVHGDISTKTMRFISRIVAMETPAHIQFRVVPASRPLLIGLYSLVGVDTHLQKESERRAARVGHSYLGRYDFIRKLPVLDDRLEP